MNYTIRKEVIHMETASREECDRLIVRIAQGDKEAFEKLYLNMKNPVFGLALTILQNFDDASDVMQETFLRVWRFAGQYRPGTDACAWVLKITRNLALAAYRKNKKTSPLELYENLLSAPEQGEKTIDRLFLQALLKMLKPKEQQVIVLFSFCSYSHKEIAKILHIPYATARWRFYSAVKKLSYFAKEENHDEHGTNCAKSTGNAFPADAGCASGHSVKD